MPPQAGDLGRQVQGEEYHRQERHTRNLAARLGAERDRLDGLPTASEIRLAVVQAERLKGFAPPSEHEPPPHWPDIEI
jgi:hypothetical protein